MPKPTEPGWYWYWYAGPARWGTIQVHVRLAGDLEGELVSEYGLVKESDAWGPLIVPPPKKLEVPEMMAWKIEVGDQMLMPDDETWCTVEGIRRMYDGRLLLTHVEGGFSQLEPHEMRKVRRKDG